MKNEQNEKSKRRRASAIPPAISAPCIEISGNREVLIEGSRGVLEYTPESVRVNTAGMIVSITGRGLNLRCISESALMIDGFVLSLGFSV